MVTNRSKAAQVQLHVVCYIVRACEACGVGNTISLSVAYHRRRETSLIFIFIYSILLAWYAYACVLYVKGWQFHHHQPAEVYRHV